VREDSGPRGPTGGGEVTNRPGRGSGRLRDISHLYLSSRRPPAGNAVPVRRCLRVGVISSGDALADAEVCANLAIQFAKLGRRTVVADAARALPNPGFRLGLEPHAYLAAVLAEPGFRIDRGVAGVRVLALPTAEAFGALEELLRETDAVLVRLPAAAAEALAPLAASLAAAEMTTTMQRVATHSPMFDAWLSTARRGEAAAPAARLESGRGAPRRDSLDVAIRVQRPGAAAGPRQVGRVLVRPLVWGDAVPAVAGACARVPPYRLHARLALAAVQPDHPAVRVFEGLAQALLSGLGSGLGRGGGGRADG